MLRVISCRCLSLANLQDQGVLLALETYPTDTDCKKRVGWTALCSKSGSGSLIERLWGKAEKMHLSWIIARPTHTLKDLRPFSYCFCLLTTSETQPMDQGVNRSLKAHYRAPTVQLFIRAVDRNQPLPKISILLAMNMLTAAWDSVRNNSSKLLQKSWHLGAVAGAWCEWHQ